MTENRILTCISTTELERRWQALRTAMRAAEIDALVFQGANDWLGGYVKWLTDIPAHNGYPRSIVFHADAPMTVIDMGAFDARRDFAGSDPVHRGVGEWFGTPAFLSVTYTQGYEGELVVEAVQRHGHRRIGLVGAGGMAHGFVNAIRFMLDGKAVLTDATDMVDAIKAVKSAEEIRLIKASADLQDNVFAKVLDYIKPGLRDIDVAAFAQHAAQTLGSEQGVVLGGSAPLGLRSSFLGRHMQGRTIEAGDHLSLLIEVNGAAGFYAEVARTIVLGRASDELLEGFEAVKAAQEHTLAQIRPGASCAAIAAVHDEFMLARGLPGEKRLYAHGQGYDMVERPLIRRDETMKLAAGMCLAVHPAFESERVFAVICDNYLVTEDGVSSCLHKTEKKVFEVT